MAWGRDLRELLHEAFRRSGLVRGVQRAQAVVAWRAVAGAEVARFTSAAALQQGTLVVDVPDPETALHLSFQRHHLLRAYAERLGPDVVRDIRFRVGRPAPDEAPPEPSASAASADPRALAALARDLQDLPEDCAGPALKAGAALLTLQARRRAAGWLPCSVCGVLHEPTAARAGRVQWCPTCLRQADLPKVERSAERLATHPGADTPALSEDERRVARFLACELAEQRTLALLPAALSDPNVRHALERAARVSAALHADVALDDVDDEHLHVVDARVLRALGRWDVATRATTTKESP